MRVRIEVSVNLMIKREISMVVTSIACVLFFTGRFKYGIG